MAILDTGLDPRTSSYLDNHRQMSQTLAQVDAAVAQACEGGGEMQVTRHHARGKLLPRERVELLIDRDSAFLELSTLAGYGSAPVSSPASRSSRAARASWPRATRRSAVARSTRTRCASWPEPRRSPWPTACR
jgi:hypothetical protein